MRLMSLSRWRDPGLASRAQCSIAFASRMKSSFFRRRSMDLITAMFALYMVIWYKMFSPPFDTAALQAATQGARTRDYYLGCKKFVDHDQLQVFDGLLQFLVIAFLLLKLTQGHKCLLEFFRLGFRGMKT